MSSEAHGLFGDGPFGGGRVSLVEHRQRYPPPPRPTRRPRPESINLIARAGLRGRGGAGFPTARKLVAVADGNARRVVVANGTEGEPASQKDELLMRRCPHLVLDGALLAAAAVGAERVLICVERSNSAAAASLRDAVAERKAEPASAVDLRLVATPPRYVAGEETGLVHWLNGGPAMPTLAPPRPFERGVDGRPTLVQNVETLAHLCQIMAFGTDWFRTHGTADEPGTMLVTVSGAVARPIVVEVAIGTPIGRLIEHAGGATERVGGLLAGGFFGTWISAQSPLDTPFSRAGLKPVAASPGAGILIVLPQAACGIRETGRILSWYAPESAGQCGPCVFGLADLARVFGALAAGEATAMDVDRLHRWTLEIEGRGACQHPNGAIRLLRSALATFPDELETHLYGGCQAASAAPYLHVPTPLQIWR